MCQTLCGLPPRSEGETDEQYYDRTGVEPSWVAEAYREIDAGHVTCPVCNETYWSEAGHPAGVPDCPFSPDEKEPEDYTHYPDICNGQVRCDFCGTFIQYQYPDGDDPDEYELDALQHHDRECTSPQNPNSGSCFDHIDYS